MQSGPEKSLFGDDQHWLAAGGSTDLPGKVDHIAGFAAIVYRGTDLKPVQASLIPGAVSFKGLCLTHPFVEQSVVGRREDEYDRLVRGEPFRAFAPANRVQYGD